MRQNNISIAHVCFKDSCMYYLILLLFFISEILYFNIQDFFNTSTFLCQINDHYQATSQDVNNLSKLQPVLLLAPLSTIQRVRMLQIHRVRKKACRWSCPVGCQVPCPVPLEQPKTTCHHPGFTWAALVDLHVSG